MAEEQQLRAKTSMQIDAWVTTANNQTVVPPDIISALVDSAETITKPELIKALVGLFSIHEDMRLRIANNVDRSPNSRAESRFETMMAFAEFMRDDSLIEDPLRFGIAVGQFIQSGR